MYTAHHSEDHSQNRLRLKYLKLENHALNVLPLMYYLSFLYFLFTYYIIACSEVFNKG